MTFDDDEWQALKAIGPGTGAFEPLHKFRMVGEAKIQSLLDKGLVEEGKSLPRNEDGYRLTENGHLAYERCIGRGPARRNDNFLGFVRLLPNSAFFHIDRSTLRHITAHLSPTWKPTPGQ